MKAKSEGLAVDRERYEEQVRAAVTESVRRQAAAGIDILTDGEQSKPGSLTLVRELFAELLPNFTSARVNVGLDEPFEMPPERADDYGAWVTTLRRLPELDGRRMLMWGDILAEHPELIPRLPEDVTVCEWGYEDWHPFGDRTATLNEAGVPHWVCPGTSSWLSILGRVTNMRGNCRNAARAGLANGSRGFVTTDWGDMGHLQYLSVSEPGFAWCGARGG